MSDFDAWWKENYEGIAYILKDDARDCWNASRSALVGEVKPVAGLFRSTSSNVIECFYYSTLLPADSHTFPQEAIDVLPLGKTVPLYSAEAIAAAHDKGREEGLREALGHLNKMLHDGEASVYDTCLATAAIERLLEKKP